MHPDGMRQPRTGMVLRSTNIWDWSAPASNCGDGRLSALELGNVLDYRFAETFDVRPSAVADPVSVARHVDHVAADVYKRQSPSCQVTFICPAAGFKHGCPEEPDFCHLTAHAVDLYPIANSNAILAHQHKPSEESDDEVLHDDREACGSETQNRRHLLRRDVYKRQGSGLSAQPRKFQLPGVGRSGRDTELSGCWEQLREKAAVLVFRRYLQ